MQGVLMTNIRGPGFYPNETSQELWERAWSWMDFVYTYRDHLPSVPILEDLHGVYSIFSTAISLFKSDPATSVRIDATPGVRAIVVRSWTLSLQDDGHLAQDPAFATLCRLIERINFSDESGALEEAIEGAGGSMENLAVLGIEHIHCVVNHPGPIDTAGHR
ncbi:hypothetical protein MVEN_00947500 [Mycena venus]|uniref:Uncharacterized protein n=1 Tax=Mycena venus TaxID=2733690 RepID=A0A8H6YAH5_9AGAR|nr:hypothetical protein MVEN_00947500 [Mycena venus]